MIYEIKNFNGGLSDFEDRGILGSFSFGSNLAIRRDIDSLYCNQDLVDEGLLAAGHSPSLSVSPSSSVSESPSPSPSPSASPSTGESPSPSTTPSLSPSLSPSVTPSASVSPSPSPSGGAGVTTVFQDLIRFFVKCSDGFTYGFGSAGYIYRRDSDGVWVQVYKDTNGAIKGAAEKPSSSKKTYLYWATDKVLKRKVIPGLANFNDVEVVDSNLGSTDWHTMRQIGGGLHIANRDFLGYVGYDDSYSNEILDLIPGNITKTLVERNGRAIIGTYRESDPNKGVNAAIDSEYPLAQVGDEGKIFFANMQDSMPVKTFPGGGYCNPDGVTNEIEQVNFFEWEEGASSWIDKQSVGNLALFAVYGADTGKGGIYSFGRSKKNAPFVLNLDYQLDADELGAITSVDGTVLVSYQDGSDFGVKAEDPNNKATAIYEGLDFKSPVKYPVNITTWKYAELFMSPLPGLCSVEFYFKLNKVGAWTRAQTADGQVSYAVSGGKKAVFAIQAEGEIFEPRIVLYPYANLSPEVHRMRLYFS